MKNINITYRMFVNSIITEYYHNRQEKENITNYIARKYSFNKIYPEVSGDHYNFNQNLTHSSYDILQLYLNKNRIILPKCTTRVAVSWSPEAIINLTCKIKNQEFVFRGKTIQDAIINSMQEWFIYGKTSFGVQIYHNYEFYGDIKLHESLYELSKDQCLNRMRRFIHWKLIDDLNIASRIRDLLYKEKDSTDFYGIFLDKYNGNFGKDSEFWTSENINKINDNKKRLGLFINIE